MRASPIFYMPYSYGYYKKEFFEHLFDNFNIGIEILDVGPGSGSYGLLLSEAFDNVDCIEIHKLYRYQFQLDDVYRNVYIGDINEFDYGNYDYLIFGDVLEHMSVDVAQKLITEITNKAIYCMVAVPYCMEQGAVGGNVHETHLQADLTHQIFLERYPQMRLLFKNHEYGYYVNYDFI